MAAKKKEEKTKVKELAFSKEQILKSEKYEKDRDVLTVILEDKSYTENEILQAIEKFKKGKVK